MFAVPTPQTSFNPTGSRLKQDIRIAEQTGEGNLVQRAYEKVKGTTFSGVRGVLRALNLPSNVVSGVLSDDYSVFDAVRGNVNPSNVIFDEYMKGQDPGFLKGLAVDIAFDPLTYVTFGAGGLVKGGISVSTKTGSQFVSKTGASLLKDYTEKFALSMTQREARKILGAEARAIPNADDLIRRASAKNANELVSTLVSQAPDRAVISRAGLSFVSDALKKAGKPVTAKNIAEALAKGIPELRDLGGIKVFGKTVVSGADARAFMGDLARKTPGYETFKKGADAITESITKPFKSGINQIKDPLQKDLVLRHFKAYANRLDDARENAYMLTSGLSKEEQKLIVQAIDEGVTNTLPKHLAPIADQVGQLFAKIAKVEQSRGILGETLQNYVTHLYQVPQERVDEVLAKVNAIPEFRKLDTPFSNARTIPTLKIAESLGLDPVYELDKILYARIASHEKAIIDQSIVRKLARDNGVARKLLEVSRGTVDLTKSELLKDANVKRIMKEYGIKKTATKSRILGAVDDYMHGRIPDTKQTMVGITNAQELNSKTAQYLTMGTDLFNSGKMREALAELNKITEAEAPALKSLLDDGSTVINKLSTRTHGLYFGTPEPSYWLNISSKNMTESLASLARFAKMTNQESFITSRRLATRAKGSRLGLTLRFMGNIADENVAKIQKIFNDEGLGLTLNQVTGEAYALNIKEWDNLTQTAFRDTADRALKALDGAGLRARSALDYYDVGIHNKNTYDRLITKGDRAVQQAGQTPGLRKAKPGELPGDLFKDGRPGLGPIATTREVVENVAVENPQWADAMLRTNNDYLVRLGDRFSKFPSKIARVKDVYVPNSVASAYSALMRQDRAYEIAQQFGVEGWLKAYDKALNFFKFSVTVPFPAFHFRNVFLGNVPNTMLEIGLRTFDPRFHGDAIRMLRGKEFDFITDLGTKYTGKELMDQAMRYGVFSRRSIRSEQIENAGGFLERATSYAKTRSEKVVGNLSKLSVSLENESKLMLYLSRIKQGMTPYEATQSVQRVLFDYDLLSPFERTIMKRVFPFWVWRSKNFVLQLKTMLQKPGVFSNYGHLVEALGRGFGEEKLSADEKEFLPQYITNRLFISYARVNNNVSILDGLDTPMEDFMEILTAPQREIIGFLTPWIKIPLEGMTGYNFFMERRIDEVTDGKVYEKLPDPLKQWLEYYEVRDKNTGEITSSVNGHKAWMLSSIFTLSGLNRAILSSSSPVETFDRMYKVLAGERQFNALDTAQMIRMMTGLRFKEVDLERSHAQFEAQIRDELETELERRNLIRKFDITTLNKDVEPVEQ